MEKEKITLLSLKKEFDDFRNTMTNFIKAVKPDFIVDDEPQIDLSKISEIGSEVELDIGTFRLVETNYNGQNVKCWQFKNVFEPNNLGLGLPNNDNSGGYPSAKSIHIFLQDFYAKLPNWLKAQIIDVDVPCYIPNNKAIENIKSKLFLLSATEMCQNHPDLAKEGLPLAYYIKNTPTFTNWHWLRTPDFTSKFFWGICYSNGIVSNGGTNLDYGVAPAFCTK